MTTQSSFKFFGSIQDTEHEHVAVCIDDETVTITDSKSQHVTIEHTTLQAIAIWVADYEQASLTSHFARSA